MICTSHICCWYSCTEFSSARILNSTTKLIPKDEKIWPGEKTYGAQHNIHALARRTPRNQLPLEHTTTKTHIHTTHKTKNNIQHRHHGPPKPPASNGSNVTGECNRRTLRDQSRSSQHGDVLFIDNTTFSFIYLTIILCAVAQRTH